jgi:DNA-binding response OmpR family regulator
MNMTPKTDGAARRTILVIDDEPSLLKVIGVRLRQDGYEVLTTTNGEEGLRLAEDRQPDLVLLDVMMPGLKGREVCARLKADPKTAHIPVIFLTALGLADHVKAGMDLGAEDYIVKPFSGDLLKQRVRVCLLRHPPKARA